MVAASVGGCLSGNECAGGGVFVGGVHTSVGGGLSENICLRSIVC